MKFYLSIALVLLMTMPLCAQNAPADTSYWRKGGVGSLTFSQVSLTNWVAGGDNSVALNGFVSMFANYRKDRTKWLNRAVFGYGLIKQGTDDFSKSDDRITLTTQYAYKLSENRDNWFFTTLLDFRTQFAEGLDSEGNLISEFMAPGYM
ncbi:MAG: DUF3078 domain-containing protein, partial [Cyclobacteriaceae bacterium]